MPTVAILEVTAACFREIQRKLSAAGYCHAFREAADGTLLIDLQGLALRDEDDEEAPGPELGAALVAAHVRGRGDA